MNRFDAMDMDLDAMYDDVRVGGEKLGFVEEELEEEILCKLLHYKILRKTENGRTMYLKSVY